MKVSPDPIVVITASYFPSDRYGLVEVWGAVCHPCDQMLVVADEGDVRQIAAEHVTAHLEATG